jgi:DNA polymerase-1
MGYPYDTDEEQYYWDSTHSIRSCFVAAPGHVLIEADFKSAEVLTLGLISGDRVLIADATGKIKMHSKNAVDMFGAPCSYEEVAKKAKNLYVAAKTVSFGVPYQRGAKAIAREINKATRGAAKCTQETAQGYIDAFYAKYANVKDYVEACKKAVHDPGYLRTPWGRRRRFFESESKSVMAAQEREAVNFPIQSTVADALSVGLFNLWAARNERRMDFRILLAIHDAVLLEVPVHEVLDVTQQLLPLCMGRVRIPEVNYCLDIDVDIYLRLGVNPKREELINYGVPEEALN